MADREFQSVINFVGNADQLFASINEINSKIQSISATPINIGGGASGASGGGFASAFTRDIKQSQDEIARLTQQGYQGLSAQMPGGMQARMQLDQLKSMNPEQIYRAWAQGTLTTAQAQERLNATLAGGTSAIDKMGGMVGRMLVSMFVWQGVNVAMNAVGQGISTVVTETLRLDTASADLATTLGTSKSTAEAYAKTMSTLGVAYGMKPAETLPIVDYAARVGKGAGAPNQQQLFDISTKLGQRTGEDPKKLIDDLNVTYRQTGISVTQLGDMAVKAFSNSGTSASDYLNILREVGPLAQASGIDIQRMAGIAAAAADRMGGSMSDAANTLTRLIKAVQEPNKLQFDVLTKYGITPGGDVQQKLTQVSQANMTAPDLASLGGRPGMPAVANDIRTMISTMMTYDGEMQRGKGLQEQWNTSTDTAQKALDRLGAAFEVSAQRILSADFVKGTANALTNILNPPNPQEEARLESTYQRETGKSPVYEQPAILQPLIGALNTYFTGNPKTTTADFEAYISKNLPLIRTGQDIQTLGMTAQETARSLASISMTPTNVQAAYNAPAAGFDPSTGGWNTPPIVGKQKMKVGLESGAYELPESATDISKYTQAQIDKAMASIPEMMENTLQSYRTFLEALGVPQEEINALVKAREDSINSAMEMYQSGTKYSVLSGKEAYFLKDALGNVSDKDAKADKQKDLEEKIKELTEATYESADQQKKANQLQGMWNIPTGAKILAPIASGAMRQPDSEGGGGGEAAWERNRQKQLEKLQKELEALKAEPAGGGIPPTEKKEPVPLRAEPTAGAIARQMAREDAAAAEADRKAAEAKRKADDSASAIATKWAGLTAPGANLAPGAPQPQGGYLRPDIPGVTSSSALFQQQQEQQAKARSEYPNFYGTGGRPTGEQDLGKVIAGAMANMVSNVSVSISASPVSVFSTLLMDGQVVAQQVQKAMTTWINDYARATGAYAGPVSQ